MKELIGDSKPIVVADNAIAARTEINEASSTGKPLIELNITTISKLLTALNECNEWGQIFILDNLSSYNPTDNRGAQSICERIMPRLSHANAAVVLSAVKVLMKYMEMMGQDTEFVTNISKKLSPPLVTLLSSEPEVQYVALKNINLFIQKRPDIMIRLTSQAKIAQVLSLLKEYSTEVDVDFVITMSEPLVDVLSRWSRVRRDVSPPCGAGGSCGHHRLLQEVS